MMSEEERAVFLSVLAQEPAFVEPQDAAEPDTHRRRQRTVGTTTAVTGPVCSGAHAGIETGPARSN